ncbi:MAG: aspartate 1-decarboxylase [Candidatus Aminicenantes bacterium]|nr:aspartate 1-decarboxylase [Candidatus Aminicenantes bacterium]
MFVCVLKAKLHNLTVTHSKIDYEGSIGLDKKWLDETGILPWEKVQVYNISNGERFETYVIEEEEGSGKVVINGAAARKAQPGDRIIVACYGIMEPEEARKHKPLIIVFEEENRIKLKK